MAKAGDKPTTKSLLDLPRSTEPPPTPEQSAEMLLSFLGAAARHAEEWRRRQWRQLAGAFPADESASPATQPHPRSRQRRDQEPGVQTRRAHVVLRRLYEERYPT